MTAPLSLPLTRRWSSTSTLTPTKRHCKTIQASLNALDLPPAHAQALPSILQLVLSHLEELEVSVSCFQSPMDADSLTALVG